LSTVRGKYDFLKNKTCPYCQSNIKTNADFIVCPSCGTPHHKECWTENGGCTTYGCPENPSTEKNLIFPGEDVGHLTPDEISESLYHPEQKKLIRCINCKSEIEEGSTYCKHCGFNQKENRFDDAKIEFDKEYKRRYREKSVFTKKRLFITLTSAAILVAAVGYLFYLTYSKLNTYFSSDEYRIKALIEIWQQSLEDKDIEKYKSLYTDDFGYFGKNGKEINLNERLKKLEPVFKSRDDIEINLSGFRIISDSTTTGNDKKIQFNQTFKSGKISENGLKTLRIYKGSETDGEWKIYREFLD